MNIEACLEALGLTPIEALAYAYLVANPSSTGYRVARGIGKPTANVYRALESLGRKGAVLQDRAGTPAFRALAPEDLLARLEEDFSRKKTRAARALASMRPHEDDERVYTLKSRDQVLSRGRIVLASARKVALLDTGATLADALTGELDDARRRGVRVLLRLRAGQDNAETGSPHRDTFVDSLSPANAGAMLRMVADAREVLMSWVGKDSEQIRDAFWTRSPLLARTTHEAMTSERCCAQIDLKMAEGLSVDEVEDVFEEWRRLLALV